MGNHKDESRIARAPEPDPERTALRRRLLSARGATPGAARDAANAALLARLDALLGEVSGEAIAIYWPVRGEPGLGALPERWTARGARLALPVVEAAGRPLRFVAWRPGEPMIAGAYGIPRPAADIALRPTLLLVPCVGFDAHGHRLGYGGGFYDRSFAQLDADGGPRPRGIGLAWDDALLPDFDPLPTDRALDAVVTPSRAVLPSSAGRPRRP
jgi:5-formyltetrahydrofolate cyclo-ligase